MTKENIYFQVKAWNAEIFSSILTNASGLQMKITFPTRLKRITGLKEPGTKQAVEMRAKLYMTESSHFKNMTNFGNIFALEEVAGKNIVNHFMQHRHIKKLQDLMVGLEMMDRLLMIGFSLLMNLTDAKVSLLWKNSGSDHLKMPWLLV